ncbi:MAG: 5-(carboxyamino)imidazole ribonucleotide synthase [Firmicutes bacterium]|nr:5-(carboxyamino)imidazole ribonucleotide synthase [Bacillota bacterium]
MNNPPANPNPLSQRIGIIGGGQLGKMMILEARKLSFRVVVLDPTPGCPCHGICDEHIVAAFDDREAIAALAEKCDVITYEFEDIDAGALLELERRGKRVYPTASSLLIIQDKFLQKQALKEGGIPVPEFACCGSAADVRVLGEKWGWPLILKARRGGYDGKGNAVAGSAGEAGEAAASLGRGDFFAEKWINFDMEVSVLACRGLDGSVAVYPVGMNEHRESILRRSTVPAPISEKAARSASEIAGKVMRVFGGVGMFGVEMFVCGDEVLVNEVAPRPHNSGHYTIESCVTSQFANHIRAVAGLPLGSPEMTVGAAVMENILGSGETEGPGSAGGQNRINGTAVPAPLYGAEAALAVPGVSLHVYGKERSARNRKMGHLTAVGRTVGEARGRAAEAMRSIRI